jgi:DNA-binding CsgD family transcriptional regulator
VGAPVKGEMSLEAIAEAEQMSVGAVNVLIGRALKKLRSQRLLITCREFATELERNRKGIVE